MARRVLLREAQTGTYCAHMDTDTMRLARIVTDLMASTGVSKLAIAERAGIPRTTLDRRLRGIQPFTATELVAVARCLDTTASSLYAQVESSAA